MCLGVEGVQFNLLHYFGETDSSNLGNLKPLLEPLSLLDDDDNLLFLECRETSAPPSTPT